MVGMMVNPKKMRRNANGEPRGGRSALEALLSEHVGELASELHRIIPDSDHAQFATYFRRYARQVAYAFVEMQRNRGNVTPSPSPSQTGAG